MIENVYTISEKGHFRKFSVVFRPGEEKEFLDKYGNARCLVMRPRTDLKPWGTREAFMEERMGRMDLLNVVDDLRKQKPTQRQKRMMEQDRIQLTRPR